MLKNSKFWLGLILGIIFVFALIMALRFLSPEDSWLCQDGHWVQHGHPATAQPRGACPEEGE